MKARTFQHSDTKSYSSAGVVSWKLDVDRIYNGIKLLVQGTYTIGTGVLSGDFPKNLFRNINLKVNDDKSIYNCKSLDVYKMNYYDFISKVTFSAAAGAFEALFVLNKALIFAAEDSLPCPVDEVRHPSLPIKNITLELTWGTASDYLSTVNNATIDSGTAYLSYDVLIPESKQEVASIWGPHMELYAMAAIYAKQAGAAIASSTEEIEAVQIGTSRLIRRGFLVTLDSATPPVASDSIVEKYSLLENVDEEKKLLSQRFRTAQLDDKTYYGLDNTLTGVTVIDFPVEVTHDAIGYLGKGKAESLKVMTKNTNSHTPQRGFCGQKSMLLRSIIGQKRRRRLWR